MKKTVFILLWGVFSWNSSFSQTSGIKGVVLDENSRPVAFANVQTSQGTGTQTSQNGFYQLQIPPLQEVTVTISHLNYKKISFKVFVKSGEFLEMNPVLKPSEEQIPEVLISSDRPPSSFLVTTLSPETIRKIPGASPGVENLLKTLPGVNSNNELSTQYSVRGGNYDENLVYVNDIEIYRPFLVRSGQQEGLSFVNNDLVKNVQFSAGGFQAEYGDKLSSVLDITYKRPKNFEASLEAGLLGASASLGGRSRDQKFSVITGLRFWDNSLLVEAKQTQTNYRPSFADLQTYASYQLSTKLELGFLGNFSRRTYRYRPLTRQTNFGTLQNPMALLVYYSGQEKDIYQTYFGALKASYAFSDSFKTQWIASAYTTREQEYYDILAQYRMGQVNAQIGDRDFGKVDFSEGIGSQLSHARNDLEAVIINVEHKGRYSFNENQVAYGMKFTREDIRDRLREYEVVDSAGFSLRPPFPDFVNNEPYEPFEAPLLPFTGINGQNHTYINRISGFLQFDKKTRLGKHETWFNLGIRNHTWQVRSKEDISRWQMVFSPRAQFYIRPNWEKDLLFRISGGLYHQPPFYRELRNPEGEVVPQVKAQQALHLVLGNEYGFLLWERPFKLISEAYYRKMHRVNPYTVENVRVRYSATNDAEAYAYGIDLRMNGEFVPGTESWVSFGFLKTEENRNHRGYIPRPTDQRLKFGVLFQDYVPKIPNLRLYLNMIYHTGLPGGSPNYSDPYLYQSRLRDYKRADVGFSYIFKDQQYHWKEKKWLDPFRELSIGMEIFNLFDVQNSITNTFVRDVYSKTHYAIPNYLTPRVFNIKLGMRF